MATKSSTKRLSIGSSLGITRGSTARGGGSLGGVTSSSGAIAQNRIEEPDIVPQARLLDTFGKAGVPNAPQATYIFNPPPLPDSTAAKNADRLAKSLGSLNSNLKGLTTNFLANEKVLNEDAKKEANILATQLVSRGGNLLAPVDKLRNNAQKIYTDTTGKYTNTQKEHAKHRYELLRNLDPRTDDYLEGAIQYQNGLNVVAGLPAFVEGSKLDNGDQFIVNPNAGEDGTPSALDILIDNHLNKQITDPNALARLRPQIVSQTANIKARMSTLYATQQDNKLTTAGNTELSNTIGSNTFTSADGTVVQIDGTGTALTMSLDGNKVWGMSLDATNKFEAALVKNAVDAFLTRVKDNPADFLELQELLAEEIANIKVGPTEQGDNRPFLYQKLGLSKEQLKQQFINLSNSENVRNQNNKRSTAVIQGREVQEKLNNAQLKIWQDSDTNTEGNQPFTYTDANGRSVEASINVLGARTWINNQRREINSSSNPAAVKLARLEALDKLETQVNKQISLERINIRINIENDLDEGIINPRKLRTQIKFLRTTGILDEETYKQLDNQIDAVIKYKDTKIEDAQNEGEDSVIKLLKGNLIGTGEGFVKGDDRLSGVEATRISTLLLSTRRAARKILLDPNLSDIDKEREIRQLYSDAEAKFKGIIQAVQTSATNFDQLAKEELSQVGYKDQINGSNVQPSSSTKTTNNQGDTTSTTNTTERTETEETQTELTTLKTKLAELQEAGPPKTRSFKDRVNYENSIKDLKTQISALESPIIEKDNPSLTTQKYWQGENVITHFNSRGEISEVPVLNLPENKKEQNLILNKAREQAVAEAEGRFNNNLTTRVSNTLGKEEWIERRTNEIAYQLLNPEAPDLRGTLVTVQGNKAESFGVTPTDVLNNISSGTGRSGKRGNVVRNKELATESKTLPLYETYIFAEQINALDNGANWIPYAGDTNLLLKKMNIDPLTFFENQYQAHFGQPMPVVLRARITRTLANGTIKGWSGNTQPFYRKDFSSSSSSEKKNNFEVGSLLNNEGVLVAGDLQPGMLGSEKKDLETKMLNVIHLGESTVDTKHGGYEAFNQGGADEGKEVLGFSGTYGDHPANKGKKLTEMTIQEILDIQDSGYNTDLYPFTDEGTKKWHDSGGIHAAGRYQFTRVGLREAMKRAGINPTEKFTPEIQDKLAITLLLELGPDQWTSMKGNKELLKLLEEYNKPDTTESSTISPSTGLA
tara:strand:- start:11498 stop:15163 length:3666 start_codon:yes stop_codon:yes gene_type:complete